MKICFSITPTDDGFTYQLYEWGFLYDVGLALGYHYFHADFDAARSQPSDAETDIYGFLGIDRHFQSLNPADEFEQYIKIRVPEYFIWQRKPWDIATLIIHIKEEVTRLAKRDKKILVQLLVSNTEEKTFVRRGKMTFNRRFLLASYYTIKLILEKRFDANRAPWRYGPDCRSIYFEQRKIQPRPSRFLPGKVRTVVHIRRGDLTTINLPLGKQMRLAPTIFMENHVEIRDFARFMRQLAARFDQYDFSTLFFSDGYERTLKHLRENKGKYHLSDEQIEVLSRQLLTKIESEFRSLENTNNSLMIIGETSENLLDFIHSCLTADVIITAAYYKFARKLGSLYFDKRHSPIMVLLHRGDIDLKKHLPVPVPTDKFIFFNVSNPDYAALEKRLKAFLPE